VAEEEALEYGIVADAEPQLGFGIVEE